MPIWNLSDVLRKYWTLCTGLVKKQYLCIDFEMSELLQSLSNSPSYLSVDLAFLGEIRKY